MDRNSASYAYGQGAGVALGLLTGRVNPCGLATWAKRGAQALHGAQAVGQYGSAVTALMRGDLLEAGLNVLGGRLSQRMAGQACFVAGTPLRTPDGSKLIEDFREGDLVLSRDEHDAAW